MKEMELTGYQLVTMPFPPRFLYRDFLKVSRNQPTATTGSRHTAVEHAVSGADDWPGADKPPWNGPLRLRRRDSADGELRRADVHRSEVGVRTFPPSHTDLIVSQRWQLQIIGQRAVRALQGGQLRPAAYPRGRRVRRVLELAFPCRRDADLPADSEDAL